MREFEIGQLVISAEIVYLSRTAFAESGIDSPAMIENVNPVPNVGSGPVDR